MNDKWYEGMSFESTCLCGANNGPKAVTVKPKLSNLLYLKQYTNFTLIDYHTIQIREY